jgi:hypothetical protein
MTIQFVSTTWLEFAWWNRGLTVYSRAIELPDDPGRPRPAAPALPVPVRKVATPTLIELRRAA